MLFDQEFRVDKPPPNLVHLARTIYDLSHYLRALALQFKIHRQIWPLNIQLSFGQSGGWGVPFTGTNILQFALWALIFHNNIMIPYKPPEVRQKAPKQLKLKSIPSIEFIYTLNSLCQGSQNAYDSKNHVLAINDIVQFQNSIQSKFGRSLKSFERQLKMLGFKTRKQRYNQYDNQKEGINVPKIYKWKGKKQLLIDEQLSNIQKGLKERRHQMQEVRRIINNQKNYIDHQIQSVIFSLVTDFQSQKAHDRLNYILTKAKTAVNQSELCMRKMINKISGTLGNELELYKLLIYKEASGQKRVNMKQDDGDGVNDIQNSEYSQPQPINQEEEDSKKSLVSIQMDHNVKEQLEEIPKSQ